MLRLHNLFAQIVHILGKNETEQLAGGPRVGRWQRQLPGVEYLLWVAHKVGNQQMHKSLQLNFTKPAGSSTIFYSFIVDSLGLFVPRRVPNLFLGLLGLSTYSLLLLLSGKNGLILALHSNAERMTPPFCIPNFSHVAIPFSQGSLASVK